VNMGKITNTLLRLGLFVMLLLGITASTAWAQNTRYTAPGASGTTCAEDDPCAVTVAINGASDNDDIAFLPGHYNVNTPSNVDVTLTFTGWNGSATDPQLVDSVTVNLGGSFDFNVADEITLTLADDFILAFTNSTNLNLGAGASIVSDDDNSDLDVLAEGA